MLRRLLIYSIIRAPPTLCYRSATTAICCALLIGFSCALFEWRCRATQRFPKLDEFVARKSAPAASSYASAGTAATCSSLSCERNISNNPIQQLLLLATAILGYLSVSWAPRFCCDCCGAARWLAASWWTCCPITWMFNGVCIKWTR